MYSSGRPFELMDVRVVDEGGHDVPKDSGEVSQQQPSPQHDMPGISLLLLARLGQLRRAWQPPAVVPAAGQGAAHSELHHGALHEGQVPPT